MLLSNLVNSRFSMREDVKGSSRLHLIRKANAKISTNTIPFKLFELQTEALRSRGYVLHKYITPRDSSIPCLIIIARGELPSELLAVPSVCEQNDVRISIKPFCNYVW